MNKAIGLVACVALLVLAGCRASRTGKTHVAKATDSAMSRMSANFFRYDWFNAHAKISVIGNDSKTDFGATIKAKKDSAIWISVSPGLGIEVARVMMTKDSVRIIDRINKKYYSRDYGVVENYTAMPVSFETMENLLAGLPLYIDTANEDGTQAIRQDTAMMLTSATGSVSNTIYLNPDYTLQRMELYDSTMGKRMNLRFRDYTREHVLPFALAREMDVNDDKQTNVIINFSRVRINEPQKMPFNVKEKYD